MGKIKEIAEIRAVLKFEDLRRFVSLQFKDILETINGNINFTDNLRCKILTVQFPQANQAVRVQHNLGSVPIGFVVIDTIVAAKVYRLGNSTASEISLASDVAAFDVKILVF